MVINQCRVVGFFLDLRDQDLQEMGLPEHGAHKVMHELPKHEAYMHE